MKDRIEWLSISKGFKSQKIKNAAFKTCWITDQKIGLWSVERIKTFESE